MDKGNLLCRHTGIDQLAANVIIDSESLFFWGICKGFQSMNFRTVQRFTLGCCGFLGSGNIAEYKLCQLVSISFFPDPENIPDTQIDLAAGIVREIGVDIR